MFNVNFPVKTYTQTIYHSPCFQGPYAQVGKKDIWSKEKLLLLPSDV